MLQFPRLGRCVCGLHMRIPLVSALSRYNICPAWLKIHVATGVLSFGVLTGIIAVDLRMCAVVGNGLIRKLRS